MQGAVTLPLDGDGYAVMRPSRHRFYGHPALIDYLIALAGRMQRENRNLLLFGDLAELWGSDADRARKPSERARRRRGGYAALAGRQTPNARAAIRQLRRRPKT
jgi:hypothetical protein